MNTLEGNKLIAEFLECNKTYNDSLYEMYGVIPSIEDGVNEQHFFYPSEMLFDTSWDWLMSVGAKCIEKGLAYTHYPFITQNIKDAVQSFEISRLYKAVLEFIQWYNKQQ